MNEQDFLSVFSNSRIASLVLLRASTVAVHIVAVFTGVDRVYVVM